MEHHEVMPIQINLRSSTPKSNDSPRCMLRIPEFVTQDMLKVPTLTLPQLPKSQSHSNSPMTICPRAAKNKDIEFPDIHERNQPDTQVINAKVVRNMRKHSSDKGIRTCKEPEAISTFPSWTANQEDLAKHGIFITKS